MPLILKIISYNNQPYAERQDVSISEQDASIGRSDTNTLVLLDEEKIISRRHATISFKNQHYTLTDNSLAGTFINDDIEPINNASVQLVDGMQIRIGKYVVAISIEEKASFVNSSIPENPFADDGIIRAQGEGNALLDTPVNDFSPGFLTEDPSLNEAGNLLTGSEGNLLNQVIPESPFADNNLLDSSAAIGKPKDNGLMSENISSLNDSYIPVDPMQSNPQAAQEEIPEGFNFEDFFKQDSDVSTPVSSPQVVQPEESSLDLNTPATESTVKIPIDCVVDAFEQPLVTATTSQACVSEEGQLLKAFLQGAKITNKDVDFNNPVEKMTRIGTMFRQFVESTVNVMRSRAEFKSLFRVSVTTIKKADNNPLKFSVTTEEAIKHLINDGQGGFKGSVESIDEGFNDLLNHQLAMQAGIQASLTEILKQFDPAAIEKQFSEGLVLQKKSKCWEKYTQVHEGLSETAVDDFFGDVFSDAYEQQMRVLKK